MKHAAACAAPVEALNDGPAGSRLAVIPTYNERENIAPIIEAVSRAGADIMIVDDASPDGTAKSARAAAPAAPTRVWLMPRPRKSGLGTAYADAFAWALAKAPGYRVLIEMDADFSHDPAMLPALAEAGERSGVAVGSRYVPGGSTPDWPAARRWLSAWANRYARRLLGLRFRRFRVRDATAGFVAWRRDVAERVLSPRPASNGYAFQIETKLRAVRAGFDIRELPIAFRDRAKGSSKIDKAVLLEAVLLPWRELFRR
jgi:dolichol-phosphate mannosyltransferase